MISQDDVEEGKEEEEEVPPKPHPFRQFCAVLDELAVKAEEKEEEEEKRKEEEAARVEEEEDKEEEAARVEVEEEDEEEEAARVEVEEEDEEEKKQEQSSALGKSFLIFVVQKVTSRKKNYFQIHGKTPTDVIDEVDANIRRAMMDEEEDQEQDEHQEEQSRGGDSGERETRIHGYFSINTSGQNTQDQPHSPP